MTEQRAKKIAKVVVTVARLAFYAAVMIVLAKLSGSYLAAFWFFAAGALALQFATAYFLTGSINGQFRRHNGRTEKWDHRKGAWVAC